ncbi:very long chain fatty acid elongase 2-like [Watersipora subatra]|uniref:very long chain fatty acid elongase 2-like n=1 Tax=Watersipora subatra TaxID=2589382 RepID=UPI00355AF97C
MDYSKNSSGPYDDLLEWMRQNEDPRTKNWFMVHETPTAIWGLTAAYLMFVLWLGPLMMKGRAAFELRGFMISYNLFQVGLSLYMVTEIIYSMFINGYHPICQPFSAKTAHLNPLELRMAQALWWYYISKPIEFMDTVLMVLRKKNSQITFLHVFHHATMFNIWWFCIRLIPGGQGWLASSLNSFVHVFMYTYYLLNLFPSVRKYLWWKRYITQLQLCQFVIVLVHTVNTYLSGCDFPMWSIVMLTAYMVILIALFTNFYVNAYKSKCEVRAVSNGKHSSRVDNNFNHVKSN